MPDVTSIILLSIGALMTLGAVVMALKTWRSLVTGRITANWQEVRRAGNPLFYWLLVAGHVVLVGLFLRSAADFLFR